MAFSPSIVRIWKDSSFVVIRGSNFGLIWRNFKDLTLYDEDPVGHHDAHNSRTIQPSNKEPMTLIKLLVIHVAMLYLTGEFTKYLSIDIGKYIYILNSLTKRILPKWETHADLPPPFEESKHIPINARIMNLSSFFSVCQIMFFRQKN